MKKRIKNLVFYVVLLLIGFLINLPIINMVGSAFKSDKEIFTNNNILPHHPTTENFSKVLSTTPYFKYVLNSLMVAVVVAVIVAIVSSLAGYA